MSFTPVILWSDALVFLLLAAGALMTWYVRRQEYLLLPWRRVAKSNVAMVSLLVLSLFLLVGMLDTLHYRVALKDKSAGQTVYSPEVLSVFDKLVEPLRLHTEKTYSAPMAMTLYAKESVTDAQGNVVRVYPKLQYTGDDGQVMSRAVTGALAGLLAGGGLVWLFSSFPRRRESSGIENHRVAVQSSARQWPLVIATLIIAGLIGMTINLASVYHVLGTDKVGQDVLYLSLKSIRTGLIIGTVTTLVTLPLALFLGVAAGYFRGLSLIHI